MHIHICFRYRIHSNELDAITDTEKRGNRLVELNVIEQSKPPEELINHPASKPDSNISYPWPLETSSFDW